MRRALRRYTNVALLGFIATFVVFLFVRFDADEVVLGIVISLAGGAVALAIFIFADKKLGGADPELYDREGNLIDSKGKILRAKSEL